jgi:predicted hydrocarbon binding protein
MMSNPSKATALFYPNKLGRILLLAFEEVLGHNGLNAALNLAGLRHLINNYPPNNLDLGFRFDDLSALHYSLEELYGPRGGRGVATRAGRICFKYGLREFGSELGVSDLAFRLLPLSMKLRVGGEVMTFTLNRFTDQMLRFEEETDCYHLHVDHCPVCWGRKADSPCCNLVTGVLQEGLFWVSGGRNFIVEEVACVAMGDPTCLYRIDRQPLD